MQPSRDISRLIEIMAALRCPETGCPWDREQTFITIVPFAIEEAYEIADAVARSDMPELKDELGDLLLQVVFQARIAEECGFFDFGSVVEAITEKMIRRHPHVFGQAPRPSAQEIEALWSEIKIEERKLRQSKRKIHSASDGESDCDNAAVPTQERFLDAIPVALPGLTRAVKLQAKAASVGFDWNDARLVLTKIREETEEIETAVESGDTEAIAEEIGDLLFTLANLARHVRTDPEAAIRRANAKFERRFSFIEAELARCRKALGTASLGEMDSLWRESKKRENRMSPMNASTISRLNSE